MERLNINKNLIFGGGTTPKGGWRHSVRIRKADYKGVAYGDL